MNIFVKKEEDLKMTGKIKREVRMNKEKIVSSGEYWLIYRGPGFLAVVWFGSAEDGIEETNDYFRRNSGYSAEKKISDFRSEPFRGRENNSEFRSVEEIEKNSHNSVMNPSAKENTTRNSISWNQNRSKLSEFRFELQYSAEENTTQSQNSFPCKNLQCCSEQFRGRETIADQKYAAAEYFKKSVRKDDFDVQTNHFVKLFCCCS